MPIDIRQTPEYAKYLSSTGWRVEQLRNTHIFIRKLPILGKVIKIQRSEGLRSEDIQILGKKYKPFQIIIEPKNRHLVSSIEHLGYKHTAPFLPSKTLILDLTKSEKFLFNKLAKDCKYALRKTEKLGFSEIELQDLSEYRNTWKKSVSLSRYVPSLSQLQSLKKSFGKKALFLLTQDKSAGAIFLIGDKSAYYWMAFTNKIGRKNLYQYRLVWEGILWAKKNKCSIFDFEGIYDERFPNKSWRGLSHFKKSFGGKEVAYPGAFTKYLPYINFGLSKRSQRLLSILFIVIAIAAFVFSSTQTQTLISIAKQYPLVAPLLVIIWRIVGTVIPPIPGGLLALAMIPVFGWFLAYLYGAIGLVIGCSIAFWLARIFGVGIVTSFIPLKQLRKFESKLSEKQEFFAFLVIRFTTGAVLDFVSYVAGLTKISFKTFFFATVISILPDALYYYLGGAIYSNFSTNTIFIALGIAFVAYIVFKQLRKRVK